MATSEAGSICGSARPSNPIGDGQAKPGTWAESPASPSCCKAAAWAPSAAPRWPPTSSLPAAAARMPTGMIPSGRPPEHPASAAAQSPAAFGDTLGGFSLSTLSPQTPVRVAREELEALPKAAACCASSCPCCALTVSSVVSKSDVLRLRLFPVLVCLMKYFWACDAT